MLFQIIIAYNMTTNRKLRIQILSLLAPEVTYSMIEQFNPTSYKDKSSIRRDEAEEAAAERQILGNEQLENMVKDVMPAAVRGDLKFNPPVSRYIFRKARAHYASHKHALAPMAKTKITRWHWDLETVVSFPFIDYKALLF